MLSQQNKTIIDNYYQHIKELVIQLETTHFHSSNEPTKVEVLKQLKVLHNKLSITHLMADRSLLAITGLQGTGKTTIIKRLYDLSDDILPENSGRGERLPVFITEKKVNKIEMYVYRAHKNEAGELSVVPEIVGAEEFNEISLNPQANRDLWLECVVPERYLKDESKSIVLLPGFEKDNKDISQLLLEHILYLSNSSVMVLRKDTFARETTQNMMHKVKKIYQNVKPVIAITFGDVNPNENAAFKQQIIEEFDITDNEQNRVVVTGEQPRFTEDWKENLMEAINCYCYATPEQDGLVNGLIQSLVTKIETLLFQIQKMMDNESNQRQLSQAQFDNRQTVLLSFESEYSEVLEQLEEQIKGTLQQRVERAQKAWRKYLNENTTLKKEIITKFFGQNPQELYALESKIEELWDQPPSEDPQDDTKVTTFLPANVEVLKIVSEFLSTFGKDVIASIDQERGTSHFQAPFLDTLEDKKAAFFAKISAKKQVPVKTMTALKNEPTLPLERINAFFTTKDKMPIRLEQPDYKAMAVIGTMLIHETYTAEAGFKKGEPKLNVDLLGQASFDGDFMKRIESLSIAAPQVLKTIPIILGVDGIVDGKFDLLTNATAALSTIGIKLSAAQLAGIIGTGFVLTYAVNAIQESVKKANERQLQLAEAGNKIFNELPSLQAKAFTDSLKRIFDKMSKQLAKKHLELSGHYDSVGEIEHILYTVRSIRLQSQHIKRAQYEQTLLF